jgi:hypothetical protein
MERKWMTTTAGIIDIICGIWGMIAGLVLIILSIASTALLQYLDTGIPEFVLIIIFLGVGIPFLILGALSLTGGIYCLRRARWGLALTGAIASLFVCTLLGIAAIIFTAISRREFNTNQSPS